MQWVTRVACGACVLMLALKVGAADLKSEVERYRRDHETAIVGELDALTRLKSVAADPQGLLAMAASLEQALKQRGFEVAALPTAPGFPPVVFGALKVPGAKRTVVFYAHYDGQPVTPSQWSSDPFVPVMRSNALSSHGQRRRLAPGRAALRSGVAALRPRRRATTKLRSSRFWRHSTP